MKKLMMVLLVLICFVRESQAETEYRSEIGFFKTGSFVVRHTTNVAVGANVDIGNGVMAGGVNIGSLNNTHRFSFGFLKKDAYQGGSALRLKYALNWNFLETSFGKFNSETDVAAGYLAGEYQLYNENQTGFDQYLYGARQYFGINLSNGDYKFQVKAGGEMVQANLSDEYGSDSKWDNYGYGIRSAAQMKIAGGIVWRTGTEVLRKRYNPERYFFTENWTTDIGLHSEVIFPAHNRVDIVPLFGYRKMNVERDNKTDLERPEFGGTVVFKGVFKSGYNAFAKGIYAPWHHKAGNETLVSFGLESGKMQAELYHKRITDKYTSFSYRESQTGTQFAWKFGGNSMKGMDDYGEMKEKYKFYRTEGFEDDRGLTESQQVERLGNIRKRNEWSGENLKYLWATGFREPDEVYRLRGGDCDEQALFHVGMDQRNGYKAYLLDYWDSGGHGVELVQDKTNGQWFLNEYGMMYKVNVASNADPKTVALAALRQNHHNLALNIIDPKNSSLRVYDSEYNAVTPYIMINSVPARSDRPQVEYGYELFTRQGWLFAD